MRVLKHLCSCSSNKLFRPPESMSTRKLFETSTFHQNLRFSPEYSLSRNFSSISLPASSESNSSKLSAHSFKRRTDTSPVLKISSFRARKLNKFNRLNKLKKTKKPTFYHAAKNQQYPISKDSEDFGTGQLRNPEESKMDRKHVSAHNTAGN